MTQNLISCDMGRSESKFVSNNHKTKFKSIIGEWHQRNLSSGGEYDVMIDGENFFIGDLALRESYLPVSMTTESKIHKETLLLFLCGISLLSQENEVVSVTTGLPVNQFNPKGKDDINNLLKGRHIVTFQGCKPKQIFIDQITVIPEGAGTFFSEIQNKPELKQGVVRVINLGSRTTNFLSIKDSNYLSKGSGTFNYGVISLNTSKANPQEFARKVIGDLASQWHDYNEEDTVLISGGGVFILDKYLRQHFKKVIVPIDPVYSDCYGFFNLGLSKYGLNKQMIAK